MTQCGRTDGDRPERLLVLARCPLSPPPPPQIDDDNADEMTGMERGREAMEHLSRGLILLILFNFRSSRLEISCSSVLGPT